MGTDDRYDDIPVVDLPVTAVDVPDPDHLQRSTRYPGAIDIDPVAAIEAGLDPRALIARDPRSRTGEAIRVIGYSAIAARVLARRGHDPERASADRAVARRDRLAGQQHRTSALRRQRRGGRTMTDRDPELLDKLAAEAEHAEATRDAALPYQRRRKSGAQSVYGLRLPIERIEQLQRAAAARGIEPSVLARQWVIEQLDRAETGSSGPADARWERDLRATTEHLRKLLDERPSA